MADTSVASEQAFFAALVARRRWVPATIALCGANLALFAWRLARGIPGSVTPDWETMLRLGASWAPRTWHGQPWRLGSSLFVHRDWIHLGYNVAFLAVMGRYVERIYGTRAFTTIYMAAALIAACAITLWHPDAVNYGASGGVAGVVGALMAFTVRRRHDVDDAVRVRLRNAGLFLIGFGALAGVLHRHVSDVGHLTGLAVGVALGWLFRR